MTAALEDTPVSYEDLADIERDFYDIETKIIRQQNTLTKPLYARRSKTVAQIPNFWPLVLEQAPPDIDQYIQPSDSTLLLSSLLSLDVEHCELDPANKTVVDPRSVTIRFEFSPNDHFSDTVLEKKLWYRKGNDGWSGLVSEPVRIHWKKDKDLTSGLLDMACDVFESEQKSNWGTARSLSDMTPEQKTLQKTIESTGMGGVSFFAWFGFVGRRITAEESAEVMAKDEERRIEIKGNNKSPPESQSAEASEEDYDREDMDLSLEIFPDGDELAIAISEDLWPDAININLALISPPNPYTLADAEWWINQSLTGQGDLSLCVLRMGCPGPEGRLVGGCGLACEDPKGFWHIPGRRPLNEKEESTTPPNRNVEVGYFLHPDVQGLGIMREAVRAAVHWGRRECGVGDVRLRVEEGNLGSRRVVEGMGEF
ncbi:putative nucleosome assembly protein C36B7.08c, partial [Amylocarpus encephaloides]